MEYCEVDEKGESVENIKFETIQIEQDKTKYDLNIEVKDNMIIFSINDKNVYIRENVIPFPFTENKNRFNSQCWVYCSSQCCLCSV